MHVDDVRAAAVLIQLRDLAVQRPGLLAGKVRLLEVNDRDRSTTYVATLRAFLDAFGDVRLAADAVGVHPNTFRYRLRRLSELAGLDLDDPEQRLVAQLQLQLAGQMTRPARGPRRTATDPEENDVTTLEAPPVIIKGVRSASRGPAW